MDSGKRPFLAPNYNALLLSMFPHMHLRGKAFEYALVESGDERRARARRVEPRPPLEASDCQTGAYSRRTNRCVAALSGTSRPASA